MKLGFFYNRLSQVTELIENYLYPESLSVYLSAFFKKNKQLGSKDRKQVKHWVYLYFKSSFICNNLQDELIYLLLGDDSSILERLRENCPIDKPVSKGNRNYPLEEFLSSNAPIVDTEILKSEKLFWFRSSQPIKMR